MFTISFNNKYNENPNANDLSCGIFKPDPLTFWLMSVSAAYFLFVLQIYKGISGYPCNLSSFINKNICVHIYIFAKYKIIHYNTLYYVIL